MEIGHYNFSTEHNFSTEPRQVTCDVKFTDHEGPFNVWNIYGLLILILMSYVDFKSSNIALDNVLHLFSTHVTILNDAYVMCYFTWPTIF